MKKIWVLYRTLRPLKWCQTVGRIWFLVRKPKVESIAVAPRVKEIALNRGILKSNSFFPPNSFQFLNKQISFSSDCQWDKMYGDKLWVYNSHYFDDLNSIDSDLKIESHKDLICLWITRNPVGETFGWDPYPLSIRSVNWIKWHCRYGSLDKNALISLEQQLTFLSKTIEYHLLGNHLIANAKALVFGGIFINNEKSKLWLSQGIKILLDQVPEQILGDGGHFERSPMYQNILIEDFLDILSITQDENSQQVLALRKLILQKLPCMLNWAFCMSHPDGDISFFNDAAFNIAPSINKLNSYADALKVPGVSQLAPSIMSSAEYVCENLKNSGYVVVQGNSIKALLDIAEIGPVYLGAHAHADTLSFELSVNDERIVVNSGTSTYAAGLLRDLERSTRLHSTVEINSLNSSEVWSSFRVGRRAHITKRKIESSGETACIQGEHNGYRYLYKSPKHKRVWEFSGNKLVVKDWVEQYRNKSLVGRFYLHPNTSILEGNDGAWELKTQAGKKIKIIVSDGIGKSCDSLYSPEFGINNLSKCLEVVLVKGYSRVEFQWEHFEAL
jgi:uncharacterized heparinase superfamily protein